jgi:parvulin-like peptidyl-prolyl isomerase
VKLGASIKPDLIDEDIKLMIRDIFNGDEAKFREEIERSNFTLDRYRELTRAKLEMRAIRNLLFTDVPPPSPKEIENEYEEVKALFRDTSKDVVSFRKILIPSSNPANPAVTPESQLLLAKDLVRQLSEGKDFSELAKSHSKDAFAANGGLQENVPRPDLEPDFASILFEATVGEVLGPLSFTSGLVIVIPVKIEFAPSPPLDDEMRAQIEQRVQRKKTSALYEKWIEKQRKQAIIKIQD